MILLIIGLTASVVFLGYAVLSRPVQQPRDVIIARVAAAAEALRVGDIQQLVDSLPPDLVKRWGAPGSLRGAMLSSLAAPSFSGIWIGSHIQLVTEGRHTIGIAEYIGHASEAGATMEIRSWLLAVSTDAGKTFGVIEGSSELFDRLGQYYPALARSLKLPVRSITVFDMETGTELRSIEQKGKWVPDEKTRAKLQELLERTREQQRSSGP